MKTHRPLLLLVLALVLLFGGPTSQARAQCADSACLHAGSTLATVSLAQSNGLDGLLSSMLGVNVDLTVANHQTLAGASLRLDTLLGALQTAGIGTTPDTAAQASISLGTLFNASAAALRTQGASGAASVLDTLTTQVASTGSGSIRVADLIGFDSRPEVLATSQVNLLDFVTGSASLFNRRNAAQVNNISLQGSALGLGNLINSVQIAARVLEPARFVCGAPGAQFQSAAMRLRARVDLVDTSVPLSIVGLAGVSLSLVDVELVVEVASGSGTLQTVNALTNALTVQATPGVASLYLGSIGDAAFFDRTTSIDIATELGLATIARLDVTLLGLVNSVGVSARGSAVGSAPSPSTLSFTGPYPQTATALTQASFASGLVSQLLGNLQVQVTIPGSWGLLQSTASSLVSLVTASLQGSSGLLAPVLNSLATGLLNPLLSDLGVRLGELDVTVDRAFRVPNGASCDDGAYCTVSDLCNGSGVCTGTARACSDGLSCTNDVCNEAADRCDATLVSGCLIGGACIDDGAPDPSNGCRACRPSLSTSAYSSVASGGSCSDGLFCTVNDRCNGLGLCLGDLRDCSDGQTCTADVCNELTDSCVSTISTGCMIDNLCIPAGAARPLFPCQVCDPLISIITWSYRAQNTSCDDGLFCTVNDSCALGVCSGALRDCSDGVLCTADACNETTDSCTHVTSGCLIQGSCIPADASEPGNPCRACNPLVSTSTWTNRGAGTVCNDQRFCTVGDACDGQGACTGSPRNCADTLACTTDGCSDSAQACTHAIDSGCVIGNSCVAAGTINPAASCQVCDPARSSTTWSAIANGTSCEDGLFCTHGDSCAAGICVPGSTPACADDGLSCTNAVCNELTDSCSNVLASGCLIGGLCVAAQAKNPTDSCQACLPSSSTTAWTGDLTTCDTDQDGLFDAYEQENGQDVDHDQDQIVDRRDPDDDGDTLLTRDENADPNHNGQPEDARDRDLDRVADYLDADDDGDGRTTKLEVEDANTYGDDVDEDGELNWHDTDTDDDGVLDVTENAGDGDANDDNIPDYVDPMFARGDVDRDGIPDDTECPNPSQTCRDTDQDGTPDWRDPDDDGDGVFTIYERPDGRDRDSDSDGTFDHLDADDDGDGIPTANEQPDRDHDGSPADAQNTDGDGAPDYLDADDDGDGLYTKHERLTPADRDGDTKPDYLDADDDGDGLSTQSEYSDPNGDHDPADARDLDQDGLPDYLDADDDGDGLSTARERSDALTYGEDVDGDQIPNWYDLDSDGDGTPDTDEATDDDGDGIPDYLRTPSSPLDAGAPDAETQPDAGLPDAQASTDAAPEDAQVEDGEASSVPEDATPGEDDADIAGPGVPDPQPPEPELDATLADAAASRLPPGRAAGGGICSAAPGVAAVRGWWMFALVALALVERRRRA